MRPPRRSDARTPSHSEGAASPVLRKSLGQHHLVDGALCRPLIHFLSLPGTDLEGRRVLEIGPGGGVLTRELLAAGARVWGWELDLAWAAALRHRLPDPRLSLVVADALEIPWSRLGDRLKGPTLVAGNLPYNVATAILERLLPHHASAPKAAFLLQKEVAERLVAKPGDDAYGALSVIVAAYAEARILGRLRPGSFRPSPKVESAYVGLTLHPPPLSADHMPAFVDLVHLAFNQRRKTLRNALAARWGREEAEAVLRRAGVDGGRRAEELECGEWVGLWTACSGAR
jgi:16S rRNA (adenine1518-N6/adenine1519-N6)-dimethyltransferase